MNILRLNPNYGGEKHWELANLHITSIANFNSFKRKQTELKRYFF